MGAIRPEPAGHVDAEDGTLGALLYADPCRPRVPESEWVALVRSIAGGDPLALQALFERTHRITFTLIMRITRDRQTAEELTLDVFHDVWRRAGSYDPDKGTVVGWIMNQARSRAIDRQRFDQRDKRVIAAHEHPVPPSAPPDCGAALERREASAQLRDALAGLTADERQAIETTFFSELTHVQAAQRLDQPLGTLKTRIRSGLAKLRHALAKGGDAR